MFVDARLQCAVKNRFRTKITCSFVRANCRTALRVFARLHTHNVDNCVAMCVQRGVNYALVQLARTHINSHDKRAYALVKHTLICVCVLARPACCASNLCLHCVRMCTMLPCLFIIIIIIISPRCLYTAQLRAVIVRGRHAID